MPVPSLRYKTPTKTFEEIRLEITPKVVSLYARGNISLQQGKYISQEDIEKMREELSE